MDAAALEAWIREFARLIEDQREYLTDLDAAIGDADHGANMHRGMQAVLAALDQSAGIESAPLLKKVGMTLVSKVGGASGPLYGTLFLRMAAATGDGELAAGDFAAALRAGLVGVQERGKAEPGDKTMLDALHPACDAFEASLAGGSELADGLAAAAAGAREGRDATTAMLARKGRASYLGERSVGHQDPGATSTALLLEAAESALSGRG